MDLVKSKHVGCYGLAKKDGKVLLIRKGRGPYTGLLDLPGGGIEYGEKPNDTIKREFMEEVGVAIKDYSLREVATNYVVWNMNENVEEDVSHYGMIYDVIIDDNDVEKIRKDADGHDSLGASWYDIKELNKEELTPFASIVLD